MSRYFLFAKLMEGRGGFKFQIKSVRRGSAFEPSFEGKKGEKMHLTVLTRKCFVIVAVFAGHYVGKLKNCLRVEKKNAGDFLARGNASFASINVPLERSPNF